MRFEGINRKFTELVSAYIGRGYIINTGTMSGHQGEIAKVDLTRGADIVRIMVDRKSVGQRLDGHYYSFDVVRLVAGRACTKYPERMVRANEIDTFRVVWNKDLSIDHCEEFYEIGEKQMKWYGTMEEAKAQKDKHRERYDRRDVRDWKDLTDNQRAVAVVLRGVRKMIGMKTLTAKEIERITRRNTKGGIRYEVRARGREVTITGRGMAWDK